ncbi:MAG: hypothetical protein HQ518_08755 [Rhodopirellula sp.]|nr:hypothetical protein [Rhodopirellula sp.]
MSFDPVFFCVLTGGKHGRGVWRSPLPPYHLTETLFAIIDLLSGSILIDASCFGWDLAQLTLP